MVSTLFDCISGEMRVGSSVVALFFQFLDFTLAGRYVPLCRFRGAKVGAFFISY